MFVLKYWWWHNNWISKNLSRSCELPNANGQISRSFVGRRPRL